MKLSDYKGEEAIELWVDLLDPIYEILRDADVSRAIKSGEKPIKIVQSILRKHKEEAVEILQRIDPQPVDGINIVMRLGSFLAEIGEREELKAFFGYAEEAKAQSEQLSSPTENIEGAEN